MKQQLTKLSNGVRVVTAHMPGSYSATVSIFAEVGSRYEDFGVNGGVSHFLEHLLFKGTKRWPSTKAISEQIDAVGGWNNAYTSAELTDYYVKVPYRQVPLALDILVDMVRNPLLKPSELDRERNVVLEEMNVYRDDPASYVHRLTPALLWPGHPLSQEVLGNEEVIKTITPAGVRTYLQNHYQPSRLVVAVAGRVNHEAIVKQAERLLGDMQDTEPQVAAPIAQELNGDIAAALTKDTAQVHLVIATTAYPYRHEYDPAAKLVATILGRGLSSRLFLNVRERQGLAYSVTAGLENYVDSGEFEVYAGVNRAKQAEAITAIIGELQRIGHEPVAKAELDKAKHQIRGGLEMAMESNGAVADRIGTQLALLGSIRSVRQVIREIDAVTPAQLRKVAAEMLAPERLRLGIISPEPDTAVNTFHELITK